MHTYSGLPRQHLMINFTMGSKAPAVIMVPKKRMANTNMTPLTATLLIPAAR